MNLLHHIALGARDVEKVASFYREAFGLSEIDRHFDTSDDLRSIWLELGEAILMIEKTRDERATVEGVGAGPFLLAFSIDEAERTKMEARLEAMGASIEERTEYSSYVRDPEGNRVAVSYYGRDR